MSVLISVFVCRDDCVAVRVDCYCAIVGVNIKIFAASYNVFGRRGGDEVFYVCGRINRWCQAQIAAYAPCSQFCRVKVVDLHVHVIGIIRPFIYL